MRTIRPGNADPIPLRHAPPPIGIVMIRFAAVLILAALVLAAMCLR